MKMIPRETARSRCARGMPTAGRSGIKTEWNRPLPGSATVILIRPDGEDKHPSRGWGPGMTDLNPRGVCYCVPRGVKPERLSVRVIAARDEVGNDRGTVFIYATGV